MAFGETALNLVYEHTPASRIADPVGHHCCSEENLWRIHRGASQAFCRRVAGRP